MKRTLAQNARFHWLVGQLNIMEDNKKDLVSSFTDGRVESSSGMQYDECQALINHLEGQLETPKVRDKLDVQRKKILSICHEMNWEVKGGRVDFSRLNAWLKKYGHAKKESLNAYTETELPTLVTQFENLLKSFYKK
jgi:hypothetical protein